VERDSRDTVRRDDNGMPAHRGTLPPHLNLLPRLESVRTEITGLVPPCTTGLRQHDRHKHKGAVTTLGRLVSNG
jgi:hypothetical protein